MRKLLLPLLAILFFTACKKQITKENVAVINPTQDVFAGRGTKVNVCHNNGVEIVIDSAAVNAHIAHGDAVDMDDDGYFNITNPCSSTDCNDNNPAINPGVTEICGNNIDDNCNGQVDENCTEVTICNQTWMRKNLDVSTYRDGTPIPQVQDESTWASLTTGAWCYYANSSINGTTYGKLYNWFAVNGDSDGDGIKDKELAPLGWHIPSDAEWTILENCLNAISPTGNVGGKMKETGTAHWLSPNTGATNSSGFTALPGGRRDPNGFFLIRDLGFWWSSTLANPLYPYTRFLFSFDGNISQFWEDKRMGFSVRCVKD